VLEATENYRTKYIIPESHTNYHYIQPLPDNELLLVRSRSRNHGRDVYDLNALVFTYDGKLQREFFLGDGIEQVQTTHEGTIWTSYFDVGVIGGSGWSQPVGRSGLIQWDQHGNKLKEFHPTGELKGIVDCYAMNVVSNIETWIYYHSQFPLVRLVNGYVEDYWLGSLRGARAFAIWRNYVLFCGSYDDRLFHMYQLEDHHKLIHMGSYDLFERVDEILSCRNHVVVRINQEFYRIDVSNLV
jgi:hypothetical protein